MDEKALRKVREKLEKAIAAGRDDVAIPLLGELVRAEPTNARWPHKQGDLLRRSGRIPEAVAAYTIAVDTYARTGFIARAVAMAKTVLSLDPSRVDVLSRVDPNAAQSLHRQARPASLLPAAVARTGTLQGRAHAAILPDDEPPPPSPPRTTTQLGMRGHAAVLPDEPPGRKTRQGGTGSHAAVLPQAPPPPKSGQRHPMVLDDEPLEPSPPPEPPSMLLEDDAAEDVPRIVDDGDPIDLTPAPAQHPAVIDEAPGPPLAAAGEARPPKAPTGPQPRLKLDDGALSTLSGAGAPKAPTGPQPKLKLDDEARSAVSGTGSGAAAIPKPPPPAAGSKPKLKLDDEALSALSSGSAPASLPKAAPKIPTGSQAVIRPGGEGVPPAPPPKAPTGPQPWVRPPQPAAAKPAPPKAPTGQQPKVSRDAPPPPRAAGGSPATISLDEDLFATEAPASAAPAPAKRAGGATGSAPHVPPPPPAAALRGRPAPPGPPPKPALTLDRLSLPPPRPAAVGPGKLPPAAAGLRAPPKAPGPAKPRVEDVPRDNAELFSRALEAAVELEVAPDAAPNETRFSNAPPSATLELSTAEVSQRPEAAREESRDAVPRSAGQLSHLPLFPLFAEVPQDVLAEMVEHTDLIELGDGDVVFRRGDPGDALYGIVEGSVGVVIPGQSTELTLAEGDVFGESCLMKDEPRHANVRVKGRLTALRVPRETLMAMLGRCPQLAELMLDLLTRRLLGNLLQTSPLFQEFDAEGRRELSRLFEVRRAAEGTQLAIAGKKMDGLYISLTGTLLVEAPRGEPRIAPPGSMFGQHTLLSHQPSPWTVTARVNLVVLRLPSAAFTRMAMQYPTVLDHLAEMSTSDIVSVTV